MDLIENLRQFNRKERYHLIGLALGNEHFHLSEVFRNKLKERIDLTEPVPEDAFWAMDYHIDWIYASLFLTFHPCGQGEGPFPNKKEKNIQANQEDVDLIVAYPEKGTSRYHMIFVEAKADTGWTNSQFRSKATRLEGIFGKDGTTWADVTPHFVVVSPKQPDGLEKDIPPWMLRSAKKELSFLRFELPPGLKVTRCENGNGSLSSAQGEYWKTVEIRTKGT
jgi:hypothetical protein